MSVLQALPEPLRSQMLKGDFSASTRDGAFQLIPTAWVDAAIARWKEPVGALPPMDVMGVDVSRGGEDESVIYRRHGSWFNRALTLPGSDAKQGQPVAALVLVNRRDGAPVAIDVLGVGSSPYDILTESIGRDVHGINVGERSGARDRSNSFGFSNLRSELWWRLREMLDPETGDNVALPPDPKLLRDLTAPYYEYRTGKIYVSSREEIIKATGSSPDYGSALMLAAMSIPKQSTIRDTAADERRNYRGI